MLNKKIVIIGAGVSGIAAASKLIENGFKNIQILEAEPNYGGRIQSKKFGDNYVELGAHWCHGEKGNIVYELANPLSLLKPTELDFDKFGFVKSDGTKLPIQQGIEQMEALMSIIKDSEFAKSEKTVGEYITENYRKILRADKHTYMNKTLENEFLIFFQNFIVGCASLSDWSQSNGIGFTTPKQCEGNQRISWNKNGFKKIFDILMVKSLQIEEKIILNTTVNKIITTSDGITIRTASGESFKADNVLVTVSLGVLKEHHNKWFEPKLPEINQKAIKCLSYGAVNKIYLEYSAPWWTNGWTTINILWTENDLVNLDDDSKWVRGILGISRLDDQPNVLAIWISGTNAATEMEQISEELVMEQVNELAVKSLEKGKHEITPPINMIRFECLLKMVFKF